MESCATGEVARVESLVDRKSVNTAMDESKAELIHKATSEPPGVERAWRDGCRRKIELPNVRVIIRRDTLRDRLNLRKRMGEYTKRTESAKMTGNAVDVGVNANADVPTAREQKKMFG
jgi:hypothetical protein